MFFRIHAFQSPGFSGFRFFWVQVFQGLGPGFRSNLLWDVSILKCLSSLKNSLKDINVIDKRTCINRSLFKQIVYKKIYECHIEWQRMTTSDNKWQRVTTNDIEWLRMKTSDSEWQQMTTSENEWQRVTTNDNEWQRMKTNENEWSCWVIFLFLE